jgi:hypothetical protein
MGPNGKLQESDRWCANIVSDTGPTFIPFTAFNSHCWDGTGASFTGQPVSAVTFLVAGALSPTPFNFCITGFATGTSVNDAP